MADQYSEPQPDDVWLTVAEIASELRVNPATVRLWISKGSLSAKRVGQRKLFIARSELDRMLRESAEPSGSRGQGRKPGEAPRRTAHQSVREGGQSLRLLPGMPVTPGPAQEASKQLQESRALWNAAIDASDNAPPDPRFVDRLRAIATAAERQRDALRVASEITAFRWRPALGSEGMILSHELRPGANRPGPEDLWTSFDRTVERLGVAMEGTSIDLVQIEYLELANVLEAIIKVLEGAGDVGKPVR